MKLYNICISRGNHGSLAAFFSRPGRKMMRVRSSKGVGPPVLRRKSVPERTFDGPTAVSLLCYCKKIHNSSIMINSRSFAYSSAAKS